MFNARKEAEIFHRPVYVNLTFNVYLTQSACDSLLMVKDIKFLTFYSIICPPPFSHALSSFLASLSFSTRTHPQSIQYRPARSQGFSSVSFFLFCFRIFTFWTTAARNDRVFEKILRNRVNTVGLLGNGIL